MNNENLSPKSHLKKYPWMEMFSTFGKTNIFKKLKKSV